MKDKPEPSEESFVYVFIEVCGQYDDSWEPLYVIEQYTNINIGITISRSATEWNSIIIALTVLLLAQIFTSSLFFDQTILQLHQTRGWHSAVMPLGRWHLCSWCSLPPTRSKAHHS